MQTDCFRLVNIGDLIEQNRPVDQKKWRNAVDLRRGSDQKKITPVGRRDLQQRETPKKHEKPFGRRAEQIQPLSIRTRHLTHS